MDDKIIITPCVSVVITIYNKEKYLKRCIDSVLSQTLKNFECILVDDCSPDNCPSICDEYANKDARIKVIHKKKNEGLYFAWRSGLELASAAYILNVDSDDFLDPSMLEKMYNPATKDNLDMVVCGFYEHISNKRFSKIYRGIDCDMRIEEFFYPFDIGTWNKLVKKEIYIKCVITQQHLFLVDFPYIVQALYYCNKIRYVSEPLYNYTIYEKRYFEIMFNPERLVDDIYYNLKIGLDFLDEKFNGDLSRFEPALSGAINNCKVMFMCTKKYRKMNIMYSLHPTSLDYIFQKPSQNTYKAKILLFLAKHKIVFPFIVIEQIFKRLKRLTRIGRIPETVRITSTGQE